MDELTIAFKIESPPSWLPIGRTAENNWRTVEIDCSYWFNMNADGKVVLMYKPSCGMSPYPLLTERDGDSVIWRPKSGELVEGVGRLQAFFEVGADVIGSSDMISCEVDSSLLGVEPGTDPGQTDLPWALDIIEQIAELSGHYPKIIDGNLYIWDSTLNDWVEFDGGDSIVDATYDDETGTLTLIPGTPNARGYVMPEWYGAKGDGITDDTVAVRRAMQEPFVLLRGTYRVTEPITCMASVVQGVGVDGGDIVCSGGNCLTFANPVKLSDFGIELPYEDTGIAITAQSDIDADWITIDGGRIGIYSTGSYKRNVVRNSTFRDLWGEYAAAMQIDFAGITEFANNYIENVSNDLDRDADGVRFWQSKNVPHTVVRVVGNEMHNCRGRFVKCSTMQCEVSDNYLHNDDNFETITSFNAIDVQNGNSLVRNNLIVAPSGINLSARVGGKQHHVVVDNELYRIARESGNKRAIAVTDYAYDSGSTIDCTIARNQIYWGNLASIHLPYIANSIYRVNDNNAYDRTYDVVVISGTEDLSCRFEMSGNKVDGYAYFAIFSKSMPNVKGDSKVYCSTPLNFSGVLPNTSFEANTSNIEGFIRTTHLNTLGTTSSYSIMLSDNNEVGAFKRNGQKIYYHAQGDPVLPKVTSADNGKTLKVVDGNYALVSE